MAEPNWSKWTNIFASSSSDSARLDNSGDDCARPVSLQDEDRLYDSDDSVDTLAALDMIEMTSEASAPAPVPAAPVSIATAPVVVIDSPAALPDANANAASDDDEFLVMAAAYLKHNPLRLRRGRPASGVIAVIEQACAEVVRDYDSNDGPTGSSSGCQVAVVQATVPTPQRSLDLLKVSVAIRPTQNAMPFAHCPLQNYIRQTMDIVLQNPDGIAYDEETLEVFADLQQTITRSPRIADWAVRLDVHRNKLSRCLVQMASFMLEASHLERTVLEQSTNRLPRTSKVYYEEVAKYDETPLWLVSKDMRSVQDVALGARTNSTDLSLSNCVSSALLARTLEASTLKIMQSKNGVNMLIRVDSKYVVLSGTTYCTILSMDRNTGENIAHSQLLCSGATRQANGYGQCSRNVCTDGYSGNIVAERYIESLRQGWSCQKHDCSSHDTATVHKKTFSIVDASISGVINLAISISNSNAMQIFRECSDAEVASRFRPRSGVPDLSESALAYKRFVLLCFYSRGQNVHIRRALLCRALRGDWRSESIDFYFGDMEITPHRVACALKLTQTCVTRTLFGRYPPVYNRGKWTGSDAAVDYQGGAEAAYELLSRSYRRFLQRLSERKQATRDGGHMMLDGQGTYLAVTDISSHEARRVDDALSSSADSKTMIDLVSAATSKARTKAARFTVESPLPSYMQIRICLEPLRQRLSTALITASPTWENQQLAKLARALRANKPSLNVRQYRLQVAASLIFENELFDSLQKVYKTPFLWNAVPKTAWTFQFRALSFRMCSRIGCATQWHLVRKRKQFPTKLYLLTDVESSSALRATLFAEIDFCPDIADSWTLDMFRLHPGFTGEAFDAKLKVSVLSGTNDISDMEILNGRLRKQVVSRIQSKKAEVISTGAFMLCKSALGALKGRKRKHAEPQADKRNVATKKVRKVYTIYLPSATRQPAVRLHTFKHHILVES